MIPQKRQSVGSSQGYVVRRFNANIGQVLIFPASWGTAWDRTRMPFMSSIGTACAPNEAPIVQPNRCIRARFFVISPSKSPSQSSLYLHCMRLIWHDKGILTDPRPACVMIDNNASPLCNPNVICGHKNGQWACIHAHRQAPRAFSTLEYSPRQRHRQPLIEFVVVAQSPIKKARAV